MRLNEQTKNFIIGASIFLIIALSLSVALIVHSFISAERGQDHPKVVVLNKQSYPHVGGNWTVFFKTEGRGDLQIIPVGGTSFGKDLKFLEIGCEDYLYPFSVVDGKILIKDFYCNSTSFEVSHVITRGAHHLKFEFLGSADYASNFATDQKDNLSEIYSTTYGQSLPFDTEVAVNLSNELFMDEGYSHSSVSNPTRLYVNASDVYLVTYSCGVKDTNAASTRSNAAGYIRKNGATELVPSRSNCYIRDGETDRNRCSVGGAFLANLSDGDYLELVIKRVEQENSNPSLVTSEDCWMNARRIRFPVVQMVDSNGGDTYSDSSELTVSLDSYDFNDSTFSPDITNNRISINEPGWYKIFYQSCSNNAPQSNRQVTETYLRKNSTRINPSLAREYYRNTGAGDYGCQQGILVYNFSSGDYVDMRDYKVVTESAGTSSTTLANQSWIVMEKLPSEDVFLGYKGSSQSVSDGSASAVTLSNYKVGDSFSHTSGGSQIDVGSSGLYEVSYVLGWDDTVVGARHIVCGYFRKNLGTTIQPSKECGMTRGDAEGRYSSVAGNVILNLSSGDSIELMASTEGGPIDLLPNQTWVSITPLNIDILAPNVNLNSPTEQYYSSNVVFNVSLNERGSCEYSLDGGITNNTMATSDDLNFNDSKDLSEGSYTVSFYCQDSAGNLNSSVSHSFYVDLTSPVVNIYSPENRTYNAASLSINYTIGDSSSGVESCWYSTNYGVTNVSLPSCQNVSYAASQGSTTLFVYSNDSVGNVGVDNVTFFVDSVFPKISFSSDTLQSGVVRAATNVYANVTLIEDNFENITFRLYDSTNTLVNEHSFTDDTRSINWTLLSDGLYYYNVTTYDLAGNYNSTETRNITLDNVDPSVDFTTGTEEDYANKSQNWVFVNLSVTELNEENTTFYLYNSTGIVSEVSYSDKTHGHNFTSLQDGTYYYNATVYDKAGQKGSTATRTISLDTVNPLIAFTTGTEANDSQFERKWIYVNVTVDESNFKNITFSLYSETGEITNSTTYFDLARKNINWTDLSDGTYYYNVTVYDFSNNLNYTETRKIGLDNTGPFIEIVLPESKTYSYNESLPLNYTVNDNLVGVDSCWWALDGGSNNSIVCGQNTTFDASDGSHTIYFYSNDSFGNLGFAERDFLVSTRGPAITLVSPENDTFYNQSPIKVLFDYTAEDPDSVVACSLYGNWNGGWHLNQTKFISWWNTAYSHRKTINISNGGSSLSNFPVYINVSYLQDMRSDFKDLRFVNGSCNENQDSELAYEIESYTSENADVWVKIPNLFSGETQICMYYGNSGAVDGQNKSAVWDDNYSFVYHMKDYTSSQVSDSARSNTGIKSGTDAPNESEGMIGLAQLFDGVNDYIYSQSNISVSSSTGWTASAWVYLNENPSSNQYILQQEGGAGRSWLYITSSNQLGSYIGGAGVLGGTVNAGEWVYVTVTIGAGSGAAKTVYVNGVSVGSGSDTTETQLEQFRIGTHKNSNGWLNGSIDDVRLSNTSRSLNWINMSYEIVANQENLVAFGDSENWTGEASFSVNLSGEGNYFWNVECNDSLGWYEFALNNFSFGIDTTSPSVDFTTGTEEDYANKSQNWVFVNLSVTELNEENTTFYLYNSTGIVSEVSYSDKTHGHNFTSLQDGTYYYNATVYDKAGQKGSTATRTISLDTVNPLIAFTTGTEANDSQFERKWIYVNVTVDESNFKNITFSLYDSLGLKTSTTYSTITGEINWTELDGGNKTYYYNVTIYDFSGNLNYTETRKITLIDTLAPKVVLFEPQNKTYYHSISMDLKYSAYDENLDSCWYNLDGGSNVSISGCENTTFDTVDGSHHLVLYVNDSAGHFNFTDVFFYSNSSLIPTPDWFIQRGSVSVDGAEIVSVSEVDPSKSFILHSLRSSDSGPDTLFVTSNFLNSQTIEFENYASGGGATVNYEIVTGPNLTVQRGIESFSTSDDEINVSINSLNLSDSFLVVSSNLNDGTGSNFPQALWTGKFYNSTLIIFQRAQNGTSGNISWQAVEWAGANVQSGSFSSTSLSGTDALSNSVDLSKSFLIFSRRIGGGSALDYANVGGYLQDSNTVSFYRRDTGSTTMYTEWFVIEWDLLKVQRGFKTLTGSTGPFDQSINSLYYLNKSFQVHSRDSTGSGTTFANSVATSEVLNKTDLRFYKGTSSQTNNASWEVIEIIEKDKPLVNLVYPDDSNFTGYVVDFFNYTVNDSSPINNCSLYGTWNEGWHLNQTDNSPSNSDSNVQNFSLINTSNDGHYSWNVKCEDLYGNIGWAELNYSFSTFLPVLKPNVFNISQTSNDGSGDITIYWNQTNHSEKYLIYYSSNLTDFHYLGETGNLNYTDTSFNGNLRRFYKVVGWNPISENSSVYLGAHVYSLKHNGYSSKNLEGFPTNFTYLKKASDLLGEKEDIDSVNMWNSSTQRRVFCNEFSCPSSISCTPTSCDFGIEGGQAYEIETNLSGPSILNWSGVGFVYPPMSLDLKKNSTDYGKNWISMYAGTTLKNARELIDSFSNSESVTKWNSESQVSRGYLRTNSPFPWIPPYLGDNFEVDIESGYEVSLNNSEVWTQQ